MSVKATATVTLTIEVKADGVWADNTSMEQIHSQARESAIRILNKCVKEEDKPKIKVIGTPKIISVMTDNS